MHIYYPICSDDCLLYDFGRVKQVLGYEFSSQHQLRENKALNKLVLVQTSTIYSNVFSLAFLIHRGAQYMFLCGMSCCGCRGAQGHGYEAEASARNCCSQSGFILCMYSRALPSHMENIFREQSTIYNSVKRKISLISQF